MTTFLTDKCTEIRNWVALGSDVYPDAVITSWIRMAEEYLSNALRVKHMIQIDTSNLIAERVPLPSDWQELRLVRTLPDGGVLRYTTVDAFYNPEWTDPPDPNNPNGKNRRYCILGNYILVGGVDTSAGTQVELTYYQDIPPLTDAANNWINIHHPTVYTLKVLHIASMYAIEDERGPTWNSEVVSLIGALNTRHQIDKASGSVLQPVLKKSFSSRRTNTYPRFGN